MDKIENKKLALAQVFGIAIKEMTGKVNPEDVSKHCTFLLNLQIEVEQAYHEFLTKEVKEEKKK